MVKKLNFKRVNFELVIIFLGIFLFMYSNSLASGFENFKVLGVAEEYLQFIIYLFRFIFGLAIIATVFLFFQGRPIWHVALGFVIVSAIVANLNFILDALNLSKGLLIL